MNTSEPNIKAVVTTSPSTIKVEDALTSIKQHLIQHVVTLNNFINQLTGICPCELPEDSPAEPPLFGTIPRIDQSSVEIEEWMDRLETCCKQLHTIV